MSKYNYKNGVTSVILRVKIMDSTSTTGAGKTGLTSASSGLIISTIADNEASPTAYTAAGSTIETITTLGTFAAPTATKCRFKEVDATNHPGLYEIQIANARWAVSNARSIIVTTLGASGAAQVDAEIQLEPVPSNMMQMGDNAQSATDLRDFADTGYDPSTHKVQGVVLTDTLTTYTGNTPQTGDNFVRLGAPAGASIAADTAAIKTDTTSIVTRIGAFTGTGVNTILGFLRAAMRSDLVAPSDVGGTFDPSDDSLQAIADNSGGGGSCDEEAIAEAVVDALTAAGIPVIIAPLFNSENLEITVPFGADLTVASALGRLELPSTVTTLNLSTAGGTIRFSVRITKELAGSTPVFNVIGTAVDATTGGFELTDPTHTRKLQPGTYFWSMTHETAGGLITPLNSGRYVVQDVATYN